MRIDRQSQITLYKATKTKQSNGALINTYTKQMTAYVEHNALQDQVSATIYGKDINNIIRLTSKNNALNEFIESKMNNSSDNISMYYIALNGVKYKIRAFYKARLYSTIDIEKI